MMKKKRRQPLSDQLRQAILASDKSRYEICKTLGILQSTMSRFVQGTGGLSMEVIDRIADLLNLHLTSRRK
jgi:plasmid maintenance system antidote protein VapI